MAVHKLIPYWVSVREADNSDRNWDQTRLQTYEPNFPNDNLADYFEGFLKEYTGEDSVHIDRDQDKTFTVDSNYWREGNTIEGRFKSGEWGRNADFWDIEEHERIEDARKENHAEEIPYYFLFHIPDQDKSQALLILSRYKRRGIKTLFRGLFDPRSRGLDVGEAYMDIDPHYSDNVLEKLEEADNIASIKLRGKEVIPAREEYAAQQSIERYDEEISANLEIGAEWKLTPQGNQKSFLEMVKGLIPGNNDTNFDYGKIEQQDFDSANVTVVEGESQLTFSLWEEEIPMRMDVDSEEYGLDIYGGYPTPHSLGCVARQLANDLMRDFNTKLETESLVPRSFAIPEEEDKPSPVAED